MSLSPSLPRGLYGIVDAAFGDPTQQAPVLLEAGCRVIQLRAKHASPAALGRWARTLRDQTRAAGACFIVNDHLGLAKACGADGLHLGQDDGGLAEARRALGSAALLGRSTHDRAQVLRACAGGADYIGFGPVFHTRTKAAAGAPRAPHALAQAVDLSTIPVIAIGGITLERLPRVQAAGVHGWAVDLGDLDRTAARRGRPGLRVAAQLLPLRQTHALHLRRQGLWPLWPLALHQVNIGVPMRSLLLTIALVLPAPAFAAKARTRGALKPPPPSATAEAELADLPALVPAEGSLWDYIEEIEGTVPADEAIAVSEELDAERTAEASFLAGSAAGVPGNSDLQDDPVGEIANDPLHLSRIDPTEFDIPIVVNDDVVRWMKYFTGSGRKYYARWMARSTRYRPMMYAKLEAAGLPRDLVYLSMIESGYATHAYSRAAAVGLWQFITPTAREWDLRVDWWIDERRDPEMATDAAVRFLGHLNKKFGHWYLAWAAYNGGPGRVSRAVTRHGTRDFWTLVEKNAFPAETDNYVPKLIAAAIIGHHPERYGFTGIEFQDELTYDVATVGPNIGVDVLARCAGLSEEDFQALNPHLRRWALPPDGKSFTVRVPEGKGKAFTAALDKVPPGERLTWRRHKVRKGETLSTIARAYGVQVSDIQKVNRIHNANRIYVGMELVMPAKGATLPPSALASTAGSGTKKAAAPRTKAVTHVVARGESLGRIAERYGVRQSDIMRWNKISNGNRIYAGQKLRVYEPASRWSSYTVRKGDTLSTIASRNGCTINELKSWNNLRSSRIYAGQKLRVRKS